MLASALQRASGLRLFTTKTRPQKLELSVFNQYGWENAIDVKNALLDALGVPEETCALKSTPSGLQFSIREALDLTLTIPKTSLDSHIARCWPQNNKPMSDMLCAASLGLDASHIRKISHNNRYYSIEIQRGYPELIFNIEEKNVVFFAAFINASINTATQDDLIMARLYNTLHTSCV